MSAIFAALFWTVGCVRQRSVVDEGIRSQTLHFNNGGEPRDFDPQTNSLPSDINIIRALMEGLVEIDPIDCHPVPGVAESWETSADGLTWTFHLRNNARWSNGDAVTASDFAYAYHRVLSPALGAEYREQFFCLKNAEAFTRGTLNDFTAVRVRAPPPPTPLLTLDLPLAHP